MWLLILAGLAVWIVLAAIVSLTVCMAAGRFNRETEANAPFREASPLSGQQAFEARARLAPHRSHP
ncbi:MAG: hypothetical protein IT318_24370 [Anaerolineales bacterium]|nr:hypothetical protein [Anaerolineales bacterium]